MPVAGWLLNESGTLSDDWESQAAYTDGGLGSQYLADAPATHESSRVRGEIGATAHYQAPATSTPDVPALEGSATVEQRTVNAPVEGSSPSLPATLSAGAAAVESFPSPTPAPLKETPATLNIRDVLLEAGWPVELHDQALAVFCGIGNRRWPNGESNCNPAAIGDNGASLGFAQLNAATWAPYCGVSPEALLDLFTNVACAWKVYQYDIGRGQAPWTQWSVKPW